MTSRAFGRGACDYGDEPMGAKQKISPCLWFDGRADEAAKFYTSIFSDSRIEASTIPAERRVT